MRVDFSYSAADDFAVVGGPSRFGFVSLLRLNLAQSLARRGVAVDARTPFDHANANRPDASPGPEDQLDFAKILRRHRLAAGLSQEALAERARLSVNGLSALERGTRRTPQRETLALLIEAMAIDGADRTAFERAARRTPSTIVEQRPSNEARDRSSADLLVVVVSPAWLADATCSEHLARFVEHQGAAAHQRIIVVRRELVDLPAIDALDGAARFDFFRDASHTRANEPYYRNDGTPIAAFYDVVEALSRTVCRIAAPPQRTATGEHHASGPTVFISPPTLDMEAPYRTLVAELGSAGYAVLPIPSPTVANLDETDLCLTNAVCSIHLLGDDDAFDDAGRSHVSFPLARAAARARSSDGAFRRILFAPKRMPDQPFVLSEDRDPIEVRDRYAEALDGDTICGDGITDFVLAVKELIRMAARRVPSQVDAPTLEAGDTVFVNFHPGDVRYARDVANALRKRGLRARFAAFEDDKTANKITNAGRVRESAAVIHCWANASDAWLYAEAAHYDDWRKFGRERPFHARAAVAGPPERGSKLLYSPDDPPEDIDVYVDLTMRDEPLPDDFEPIVAIIHEPRPR